MNKQGFPDESEKAYSMAKMIFRPSDQVSQSKFDTLEDRNLVLELLAEYHELLAKPLVNTIGHTHKDTAAAELRARRQDLKGELRKNLPRICERLRSVHVLTSPEMPLANFGSFSKW